VHLSGKAEFDISMRKAFLAGGAIFFSDEFSFAGSLTVGNQVQNNEVKYFYESEAHPNLR